MIFGEKVAEEDVQFLLRSATLADRRVTVRGVVLKSLVTHMLNAHGIDLRQTSNYWIWEMGSNGVPDLVIVRLPMVEG